MPRCTISEPNNSIFELPFAVMAKELILQTFQGLPKKKICILINMSGDGRLFIIIDVLKKEITTAVGL